MPGTPAQPAPRTPHALQRGALAVPAVVAFYLGAAKAGTWQAAVESGQVLAGIVDYPLDNPFYVYHAEAWTLANQLAGGALWLGMGEEAVSLFISGMLPAVTCLAFTLITYGISGSVPWSVFVPLAYLGFYGMGAPAGLVYPIVIGGTHHTYGVLGRAAAALTLGFMAVGWRCSAAFLIGLIPAIHPAWGAWVWMVAAAVVVVAYTQRVKPSRSVVIAFAAGAATAAVSFGIQQAYPVAESAANPDELAAISTAFREFWDSHRAPAPLFEPGVYTAIALLGSMGVMLGIRRTNDAPRWIYWSLAIASLFALGGCLLTYVSDWTPLLVDALMPGRYINVVILLFPVVAMALLGACEHRPVARFMMAGLAIYLLLNWAVINPLEGRLAWRLEHWKVFGLVLVGAIGLAIAHREPNDSDFAPLSRKPAFALWVAVVGIYVAFGPLVGRGVWNAPYGPERDAAVRAATRGEGLLLTAGGMELIQLRTARPLVLNTGALDQIPVIPQTGPALRRRLADLYGIDLLDPPEAIRQARPGALLGQSGREVWEQRPAAEWRRLAGRYGFTEVMAPREFTLELPRAATSEEYALYRLNEPETPPAP